MELKIKRLHKGAKLPEAQTDGAAAFDLTTPQDLQINPGTQRVPLGIAIEIPNGYCAQLRSRSSVSLQGVKDSRYFAPHRVKVETGLIDSDYRGEINAIVTSYAKDTFVLAKGTRIAQLQLLPVPTFQPVEVDRLSITKRQSGGFGSTNK